MRSPVLLSCTFGLVLVHAASGADAASEAPDAWVLRTFRVSAGPIDSPGLSDTLFLVGAVDVDVAVVVVHLAARVHAPWSQRMRVGDQVISPPGLGIPSSDRSARLEHHPVAGPAPSSPERVTRVACQKSFADGGAGATWTRRTPCQRVAPKSPWSGCRWARRAWVEGLIPAPRILRTCFRLSASPSIQ